LSKLSGYGIGSYTFRVLYSLIVLTIVSVFVLRYSPAKPGWPWCIGASLQAILPAVTLSKEFSNFFDHRKINRFKGWHIAYFSVISIAGWVLGLFLVAALTGLTQKP